MLKNASAGEKAGWFNGRTPLFSQKDLLRLVGPLLIEQFLAVTVGMADTMMVSRCGEAAISGVSLVDMINNLIIVLFAALATGGAVVVSQYLGAKEQEKANASAGQLILLSAILGTVVAAVCILFARPMISACYGSIDADVLDAGVLYLKITALSYPFLALYNAGAALFRSMGNSKISMQISVLMNIINIVGNAVCIFGLKMGVDGVAWPSVVSRVIAAVLILGRCYQKGHALTVPKTVKLDTGMAKRILGMGDMLTLIEKAEAAFDAKKAAELEQKLKSNKFTLSDFYDQLSQLKNMGSLDEIAAMMPGMNAGALKGAQVDEKAMGRTAAIIQSMTPYERENPSVLNSSRKRRIALGAGVKVEDINKLLKQFDMMNQMMKQFSGPGAAKKMKRMGKFGGMGGLGGFPGL